MQKKNEPSDQQGGGSQNVQDKARLFQTDVTCFALFSLRQRVSTSVIVFIVVPVAIDAFFLLPLLFLITTPSIPY